MGEKSDIPKNRIRTALVEKPPCGILIDDVALIKMKIFTGMGKTCAGTD